MKRTLWALAALALPLMVPAALAQAPGDSVPPNAEWVLFPQQPCAEDDVILHVRGYEATPCDSFISAYRAGNRLVIVRRLMHVDLRCFAAPSSFYSVPTHFGPLPAGPQSITIRTHWLGQHGDGRLDSTITETQVDFEVAANCVPPPTIPVDELPYVDFVTTDPSPACPERPTSIVVAGHFLDGCGLVTDVDEVRRRITLAPYAPRKTACPEYLKPWRAELPLGFLATGNHIALFDLDVLGTSDWWPPVPARRYVSQFGFRVAANCDSAPQDSLPYVREIQIFPKRRSPLYGDTLSLGNPSICPDDSIVVHVLGTFPNGCFSIERVELLPSLHMSPLPGPPTVRLVVDDHGCQDRFCLPHPVEWEAAAILPPLPSRDYQLPFQLGVVTCSDSILPHRLFSTLVPFRVVSADSCSTSVPRCLAGDWERRGPVACDAFLSPSHDDSVELTFEVATGVALSGLQGTLRFVEPGLEVKKLEAIGPASGMHLTWTQSDGFGARFVLFAEQGAPIPVSRGGVPVLRVTVGIAPTRVAWPDPPIWRLAAEELFGSNVDGLGVIDCSALYGMRPEPPLARICLERACDFNADNTADVRDLVLMVHCFNGSRSCPWDTGQFDCDGDGRFGLPDVLCCAARVLRGPDCPGCPVDSIRVEPSVRASLAAPVRTQEGVDVTVRLQGTDRIGAARLGLQFPSDRFRVAGVRLIGPSGEWLEPLHEETSANQLSLGLIRTGIVSLELTDNLPSSIDVVLHLELKPGATVGGEVRVEGGEFSGPDGVLLDVQLGAPGRSLGASALLMVSPVRPNPSRGTVQFSVTLDRDAPFDIGIYDVAGRRVADLFHGERPAGTHDFRWDGRASRGGTALEGVYFLRATIGREAVVKRMVLLRRSVSPALNP